MAGERGNTKQELRARLRARRAGADAAERARADAAIAGRVVALDAYARADVVLTYLSFGGEVDTWAIIRHAWSARKVVAIPYCVPGTRQMRWFRIASFDGLVRSGLGVEEPDPATFEEVLPAALDPRRAVTLVPALAFDADGYRLGYGAGFYDVFLSDFAGTSVGLCRSSQLVESLAAAGCVDAHDVPVDVLVTDAAASAICTQKRKFWA